MRAILPSTKRLLSTLMQVTAERNALAKERDALKAQLQRLGTDASSLEEAKNADPAMAAIKSFIDQINELTGRVNELTGKHNALTGRNNELTHQVNVLTGRNNELTHQVNVLTGEQNDLVGQVNNLTGERDALAGKLNPRRSSTTVP
jgi:chromosome segregation ATPase